MTRFLMSRLATTTQEKTRGEGPYVPLKTFSSKKSSVAQAKIPKLITTCRTRNQLLERKNHNRQKTFTANGSNHQSYSSSSKPKNNLQTTSLIINQMKLRNLGTPIPQIMRIKCAYSLFLEFQCMKETTRGSKSRRKTLLVDPSITLSIQIHLRKGDKIHQVDRSSTSISSFKSARMCKTWSNQALTLSNEC